MAFKRLDSVTRQVISRLVVDGEDAAATVSVKPGKGKAADAEAPAQVNRETRQTEGETTLHPSTMDRCSPAHSKGARPTLGAGRHMFMVIEGGRPDTGGGGPVPAGHTRDNGRGPARELRLVSG